MTEYALGTAWYVRSTGETSLLPYIDYSACTGCGACAELYPLFFVIRDEKAWLINHEKFEFEKHGRVVLCCPFGAIILESFE